MTKSLRSIRAVLTRLTVGGQVSLAFGAVLLLTASIGLFARQHR
jgi:hypothetical protein